MLQTDIASSLTRSLAHCRRRKIRCLLTPDDPQNRCTTCIKLNKNCSFVKTEPQLHGGRPSLWCNDKNDRIRAARSSDASSSSSASDPPTDEQGNNVSSSVSDPLTDEQGNNASGGPFEQVLHSKEPILGLVGSKSSEAKEQYLLRSVPYAR